MITPPDSPVEAERKRKVYMHAALQAAKLPECFDGITDVQKFMVDHLATSLRAASIASAPKKAIGNMPNNMTKMAYQKECKRLGLDPFGKIHLVTENLPPPEEPAHYKDPDHSSAAQEIKEIEEVNVCDDDIVESLPDLETRGNGYDDCSSSNDDSTGSCPLLLPRDPDVDWNDDSDSEASNDREEQYYFESDVVEESVNIVSTEDIHEWLVNSSATVNVM